MANIGSGKSKRKTTAAVFFTPTGETGGYPLGNVVSWKRNNTDEVAEHMKSVGGIRILDESRTRTLRYAYEFILTEHTDQIIKLLQKGVKGSNADQASGTDATAQFTSVVLGKAYSLGAYNVSAVVVEVSSSAKTLGTDYLLDAAAGKIIILATGTIAAGATVDVTFNKPAITIETFDTASDPQVEGAFELVITDTLSGIPTEIHTWTGSIRVSDPGDNADDFNQVTVEAVCHTTPVVKVPVR